MEDSQTVIRHLASLNKMNLAELHAKYVEVFGADTNCNAVAYLRKRLAYRIQEMFYGGLSKVEKVTLDEIADKDPAANLKKTSPAQKETARGTRYSRVWHNKKYLVIATGKGTFEYNGKVYKSLSAVAKAITGTQWNGKKFFGLTGEKKNV